jgi:ABC-type nitrate/sulfonate/bicarbonate transport system substrate-binding protein
MRSTLVSRLARLAALASLALGLGAAPALAQPVKLRVSTIPIIDTAPLQVGIAKGFFAAEGLEIDTTPTAGGAAGLPALAAGQVQISFSNVISVILAARQGLGFEVIAAGSGMEALGSALFVAACSAVGAPQLEQTSEPSLISATDMSQVVRLKYTE